MGEMGCEDDEVQHTLAEVELAGADVRRAARAPEVKIKVTSGLGEERVVPLRHGRRPAEILEIFAGERGCKAEELVLVIEGGAEPVTIDIVLDENYPSHKRHYVHHAEPVDVFVSYQSATKNREFRRHATVNEVLIWAIKVFGVDPTMATEFELTRQGDKTALPGKEHVGHLAGQHKRLHLDLVRGDMANGSFE
jgi:hypothetical protein